jgi:hypothetical protein
MSVSAQISKETTDRTKKGKTARQNKTNGPSNPSEFKLPRSGLVQQLTLAHDRWRRVSVSLWTISLSKRANAQFFINRV